MEGFDKVDVVILGGSLAGLVSASKLVSQGLTIAVIDLQINNKHFDQLRTIPVSKPAFLNMQIPYLEKGFQNQKKYAAYVYRSLDLMRIHISPFFQDTPKTYSSHHILGDICFDRSTSLIIDYPAFRHFLLHLIEKSHSKIYTCTSITLNTTSPPFSINIVNNQNEQIIIHSEYILIDTVLDEHMLKELGFVPPKILSESRFLELEGVLTDSIDVFVDFTSIPSGYLLAYPLTSSTQFLVATSGNSTQIQFEKLTDFIKTFYLLDDKTTLSWSPPRYSYSFDKQRDLCKNNIILVGDALGTSNPLTFSDCLAGIQSALLASTAINILIKDKTRSFTDVTENIFLKTFLKLPYTDPLHEEAAKYFYGLSSQKLFQLAKIFHYLDLSRLTWYQRYFLALKLVQKKLYTDNKQLQRLWQSYQLNRIWLI